MKAVITLIAAAAGLALGGPAQANEALAKTSGCLACHTVDKKLIGPSYKEIADKYRKDKGAEANLIKKVKDGGKGTWGDIPMPPNGHVKDPDIKAIVEWILSLK
jgi:cytochrome c